MRIPNTKKAKGLSGSGSFVVNVITQSSVFFHNFIAPLSLSVKTVVWFGEVAPSVVGTAL